VLQDPETHLWQPLQEFLTNHALLVAEEEEENEEEEESSSSSSSSSSRRCGRRQARQKGSIATAAGAATAIGACVPLRRLVKLCIMSWLLAEALTWTGIMDLGDNSDAASRRRRQEPLLLLLFRQVLERFQRFWKLDSKSARVQDWWRSVIENPKRLWTPLETRLEPRYQWAVGATVGMIASPTLWPLSRSLAMLGLYAYALGETNRFLRHQQGIVWYDDDDDVDDKTSCNDNLHTWMSHLDEALEQWRQMVRMTIDNPVHAFESIRHTVDTKLRKDLSMPLNVEKGFFFGLVLGMIVGI
jgi:hypothetical protein